ncbi:MAG: PspC domain-containing protein [Chloroflexota bacterium]
MTSDQPDTAAQPTSRPFRRRATDRVIGGVAAGIADYFNVDPLLIRAAFVGLMIFGGAGLVLYVGAWLLIPVEGEDDSVAESVLHRLGMRRGSLATSLVLIALLLFIAFVALPSQGGYVGVDPGYYISGPVLLIAAMVVLGVLLLRRGGSRADAAVAQPAGAAAPALRAERTVVVRAPRVRVPRGPLGWYTLAAALLGIGLLALVDNATDATVTPGQFFGLTLAIVGIGLVVGSWWGNARLLILPALLVLPVAWAASYVTVPLEGGTGDQWFSPVTVQELQDEYRMVGGRLTLDLRDLEAGTEPIRISASVAFGTLSVLLPVDAQVELDSHVGAGGSNILGSYQSGTELTERYVRGKSGPHFVLDLGSGIGYVWVEEMGR